jgi:predicted site-specific integrase-resolvase
MEFVDRVYSRKNTAALLGVCEKTLRRLELSGQLKRVNITPRKVGYRASEIERFLSEREAA